MKDDLMKEMKIMVIKEMKDALINIKKNRMKLLKISKY